MEKKNKEAKILKIKNNWSPVWILPVLTIFIGIWIIFYYYSHQGPVVTLITKNAEGIEKGKTAIKIQNVNVGIVESTILMDDLSHVKIKVRLNPGMEKLLHSDSVFWVVKPQLRREGISGLDTLFSGVYIEFQPGKRSHQSDDYQLLDSPPLVFPDAKGIHIILKSKKEEKLNPGDPVLFHGYKVGYVEGSTFNLQKRIINYQIFITAPNDRLVTSNVRFWRENGISINLAASDIQVEIRALTKFFNGSVSFDVPEGSSLGYPVSEKAEFQLYENQKNIQDDLYTKYIDYLMFFNTSIRGLKKGAPVEFRGIRLGTVAQVPFFIPDLRKIFNDDDYHIPVLIRIEPDRLINQINDRHYVSTYISELINHDLLQGVLKVENILTGSLYVDMDFYPKEKKVITIHKFGGYKIIPTGKSDITQMQVGLIDTLNKINTLPLNLVVQKTTNTLSQSQSMMQHLQTTLDNFNKLITNQTIQNLPKDMKKTMHILDISMQSFYSNSIFHKKILSSIQNFDQVLCEFHSVLKTLNEKSNALVFTIKNKKDPQPKRIKR